MWAAWGVSYWVARDMGWGGGFDDSGETVEGTVTGSLLFVGMRLRACPFMNHRLA
jgi:hypothetical protein